MLCFSFPATHVGYASWVHRCSVLCRVHMSLPTQKAGLTLRFVSCSGFVHDTDESLTVL